MAGTIEFCPVRLPRAVQVSMESGLDGRNNLGMPDAVAQVSGFDVSMESGLDGRNNTAAHSHPRAEAIRLNGVRPRWPEQ